MAELDEALGLERELLERLLFKLVVSRLVRRTEGKADADVAHRHLEEAAMATRSAPAPHLSIIAQLCGAEVTAVAGLATLAASAPEPYRTMFEGHLADFALVEDELTGAPIEGGTRSEPHLALLSSVLYRAARGRLSGCAAPELADFILSRMHRPGGDAA
jgi:hypothetical protein